MDPMTKEKTVVQLLRIASSRGIALILVDGRLKASGPEAALATLKTTIAVNKDAIVEYLRTNPSPVATKNQEGQGERRAPTPLAILANLNLAGAYRPWRPTAVDIDLALWLTEAHQNCQRDDSGNVVDAGIVIDPEGRPVNITATVAALARGPQVDARGKQTETPAAWLDRIAKLKALLDDQTLRWRATTGWRSADWPAELKRAPRPPSNPVARKEVTTQ